MVDEAALDTVFDTMLQDDQTRIGMLAEWGSDHDYFSDAGFSRMGAHRRSWPLRARLRACGSLARGPSAA